MARKAAATVAKAKPVSVRFSPDDRAWLADAGAQTSATEVITRAIALLRRQENALYEPDPDAGFVPNEQPVTPAEFAALKVTVERMAMDVTALAGEVRAASVRDDKALGAMTDQFAKAYKAALCFSDLLGVSSFPTALDSWEARRSS